MREAKLPLARERTEFLRRASVCAELARRARASSEPLDGSIDFALCELYRQSIRWSLRALAAPLYEDASEPAPIAWHLLDDPKLLKTVGDPALLARAKHWLRDSDPDSFTELDAAASSALEAIARALIVELREPERIAEALWIQRVFRIGLVAIVLGAIALALVLAANARERKRDLAVGKPWRASSLYSTPGCHSPAQSCDDSPDFFVHTQEQPNPWVEFDLGSVQSVSAVRVLNRKDCCTDRIAPLVIEVSTDQNAWKGVARRDTTFTDWLANFPATNARWVRLRVDRTSMLHLLGVRILR